MTAGNIFVIFSIVIAISPLGKVIILGKDAKPEYSYVSWFALLFAAGMGTHLVYYRIIMGVKLGLLREDIDTRLALNMVVAMEPMIMINDGLAGAGGYESMTY